MKLQTKALLAVAGIIAILTAVSAFVEVRHQLTENEQFLNEFHANSVATAIMACENAILKHDAAATFVGMRSLFQSESVKRVQVVSIDGRVLAGLKRPSLGGGTSSNLGQADLLPQNSAVSEISDAPVPDTEAIMTPDGAGKPFTAFTPRPIELIAVAQLDGEMRRITATLWQRPNVAMAPIFHGHVIVDYSLEQGLTKARQTAYRMIIVNVCVGLLMVVMLVFATHRSIIDPLNSLAKASSRLAGGDFSAAVDIAGSDEIGQLARTFDEMRIKLKDFTENMRKMSEQRSVEFVEQKRQAIETERLEGICEMAGGIAHEINNPLAIIQLRAGFIQNLIAQEPVNVVDVKKNLESLTQASNRIKSTIESLLIFVGQDNTVAVTEVMLIDIFDRLSVLVKPVLENAFIDFRILNMPEGMSLRISPSEFLHLFYHLVKNSCDQLIGRYDGWIRIEFHDFRNMIEFRIVDSGNGISPDLAKRMFEPFFTTKTVGKGAGLGLSVCKGIVDGYNGQIFYDQNCQNTTFIIRFPTIAVVSNLGVRAA